MDFRKQKQKLIRGAGFEHTATAFRTDVARIIGGLRRKYSKPHCDMLFVHIPKTAGTSVYKALLECYGMKRFEYLRRAHTFSNKGAVTFDHMCLNNLRSAGVVTDKYLKSAYKFAITRDPYERAVSLYNHLSNIGRIDPETSFSEFLDLVHLKRPTIGLFTVASLSQTNPQTSWLIDANGGFIVDETFDIQEISKLSVELQKRFGRTPHVMRHKINDKKITVQEALQAPGIVDKIETIYARDFDVLNYPRLSRS